MFSKKYETAQLHFNIDDNNMKCFLSSKSAYYNDFWRIMWHLKTGVMMLIVKMQ